MHEVLGAASDEILGGDWLFLFGYELLNGGES